MTAPDANAAGHLPRLARLHEQTYQQPIQSAGFAPGRVNLMGDHVDYCGGAVLPIAIAEGTTCVMTPRDDQRVRVQSLQMGPTVHDFDLSDVDPRRELGWLAYVVGSLAIAREHGWIDHGVDVTVHSTVPLGAGLSSSASLECSVLVTALGLSQHTVDPMDVALAAQRAEHEYAHVPCGIMDQATSMLGRAGHALLLDTATLETSYIPLHLDQLGLDIVLIDTNAHHLLSSGGYSERRQETETSRDLLGIPFLAHHDDFSAVAALTPPLDRRSRHVMSEQQRVRATAAAFEQGRPDLLAQYFHSSHESLAEDFEVSCPELDVAVQAALRGGAVAARMTGGGFGGSVVALCAPKSKPSVIQHARDSFREFGFDAPSFLDAVPSDGARLLPLAT